MVHRRVVRQTSQTSACGLVLMYVQVMQCQVDVGDGDASAQIDAEDATSVVSGAAAAPTAATTGAEDDVSGWGSGPDPLLVPCDAAGAVLNMAVMLGCPVPPAIPLLGLFVAGAVAVVALRLVPAADDDGVDVDVSPRVAAPPKSARPIWLREPCFATTCWACCRVEPCFFGFLTADTRSFAVLAEAFSSTMGLG